MTIDNNDLLNSILTSLDRVRFISPEDIPNIDLYMDQITTFMDSHLHSTARNPGEDKILTKTMINNYAKNDLLPPPVKKKYSKEHMLMLIFIYYFKNLLSFHDIEHLFKPLIGEHFDEPGGLSLEDIYREVFSMEKDQMERLKSDVTDKFQKSQETFSKAAKEDRDYLQLFSFICALAFDVYLKKQMIETLIDQICEEETN